MDLSLPLRSVVPTLDAEVLTVLAGTETPLTGSAVSRLAARGSRAGIQLVLDRLATQGLVEAQQAGRATLYVLNRAHLLVPAILSIVAARRDLLDRMRVNVAAWTVQPVHASLFGSVARQDAGPDSDVDVLVVRPASLPVDDATWQQQLRDLEEAVVRWTGNALAWFETTEGDLRRALDAEEPLIASWHADGVRLAGVDLRDLLRKVSA